MRGSIVNQVTNAFKSVCKYGSSRYTAKQEALQQGYRTSKEVNSNLGVYSYKTMENYKVASLNAMQYIKEEFNVKDISKVTGEHLQAYLNERSTQVSYSTLQGDIAALSKLELAINTMLNNYNIADRVDFKTTLEQFRSDIKEDKEYCSKELESRAYINPVEVVNNINSDTYKLAAELQLNYGFRINEVSSINLDKQLNNNILTVSGKGGQLISKELQENHISQLKALSHNNNFNINKVEYGKELKAACLQAGERYTGSHALRHNYAQEQFKSYAAAGYNERECLLKVAEDMGHHREDITMTYLR